MVLVRKDVHRKWGEPTWVDENLPQLHLKGVLQTVPDDSRCWLPSDAQLRWSDTTPPWGEADGPVTEPLVVGGVDDGGWGKKVYTHMVPATKSSSWGPGGRTHLVAQRRSDGSWWARQLVRAEVARIFGHPQIHIELAEDDDKAIAELGNAGPLRMIRPWALGIAKFLRPPMQWCPVRIQELVTDDERRVCRGWMAQAECDFGHMRHMQ